MTATASVALPVLAYVAQMRGHATARWSRQPPRQLLRFSPLYAGDVVKVARGGKVTVRFLQSGQTQTFTASTSASSHRLRPPRLPRNDLMARMWRTISNQEQSSLVKASHNAHTAARPGPPSVLPTVEALVPRGKTLARGLVFRWKQLLPGPVHLAIYNDAGQPIWTHDSAKGEALAYPATAPRLEPGTEYQWRVSIPNQTDTAEADFEIASAAEERDIQARLVALNHFAFTDRQEHCLLRASLLADQGLYANVVEELIPLQKRVSPMVHVLRWQAWDALKEEDMESIEWKALGTKGRRLCSQWDRTGASAK